jgi:ATP-binding cassette subfamily C protein
MITLVRSCFSLLDQAARRRLALLSALIFSNTILEILSIGMILPFIALLSRPQLVETNSIARHVYEKLGFSSPNELLLLFGVTLLFLVVFKNVYLFFVTRAQYRFSFGQAALVSTRLFERYLRAPYAVHLNRNPADLITTADYSTDQAFQNGIMSLLIMATEASAVIGIIVLMLVAEPIPTLVLIALLGLCGYVLGRLMHRRTIVLGEVSLGLRMARLRTLTQALSAIKELMAFGREDFFRDRFQTLRFKHADAQSQAAVLGQAPRMVIETVVVGGLMLAVVVILLQNRTLPEIMSVLALFAMAAFRIMPGVNRIFVAFNAVKNAKAVVDSIAADLNDPLLESKFPVKANNSPLNAGEITFRGVCFAYDNAPRSALIDISLTIERGESVGFVGASGAGKSTLVDILIGLLKPTRGSIEVNGDDLAASPSRWRRLIGYVPQMITLIDDTIRNNVAFGIAEDEIDDQRIWHVLAMARLEDHCRSMPEGLDTMLGERGVRLSGGERQRVGIARALYHDPEILVFDEATSALDNESEYEITKTVEALRGQKTLVIIAHRLSTVKSCDRLILMQNGRISDSGNFQTLLNRSAEFRSMVQLAELEPETPVKATLR